MQHHVRSTSQPAPTQLEGAPLCRDSSSGTDTDLSSKTSAEMGGMTGAVTEPEKAAAKRRGRFHVVEDAVAEAGGAKAGAPSSAPGPRPSVSRNSSSGARGL